VESFFKRQMNLKPGAPLPLFDQLDFVFGAVFFAWIWVVLSAGQINGAFNRMLGWTRFLVILLITPFMHLVANFIAWIWKLKKTHGNSLYKQKTTADSDSRTLITLFVAAGHVSNRRRTDRPRFLTPYLIPHSIYKPYRFPLKF